MGSSLKDDKALSAVRGSSNKSAETLLDPVRWDWRDRFCRIAWRNVAKSNATKPVQARSRAGALTNIFILVSFQAIECLRTVGIVLNLLSMDFSSQRPPLSANRN